MDDSNAWLHQRESFKQLKTSMLLIANVHEVKMLICYLSPSSVVGAVHLLAVHLLAVLKAPKLHRTLSSEKDDMHLLPIANWSHLVFFLIQFGKMSPCKRRDGMQLINKSRGRGWPLFQDVLIVPFF